MRLLTPARALVAVALMVAVIAAGTAGGWQLQPRRWWETLSPDFTTSQTDYEPVAQMPPLTGLSPLQRWVAGGLIILAGSAILVLLIYLVRWLWRRRPRRAVLVESPPDTTPAGVLATEPDLATLVRGAEAAELILGEADGVPRDLILRCWLALEEASAASGAARRPADSPTEFTGRVLRATQADPASVDTLLHLYHQARFSRHPVSDDDVRSARTAVVKLARIWRGFDTAMRHTVEDRS
ncbi:MAG: DUF4129 domain-containing protein [Microlunatus sp.]